MGGALGLLAVVDLESTVWVPESGIVMKGTHQISESLGTDK